MKPQCPSPVAEQKKATIVTKLKSLFKMNRNKTTPHPPESTSSTCSEHGVDEHGNSKDTELKISFEFQRSLLWDEDSPEESSLGSSTGSARGFSFGPRCVSFSGLSGAAMSGNKTQGRTSVGGLLLHLDSPRMFKSLSPSDTNHDLIGRSNSTPSMRIIREQPTIDLQAAGGPAGEDRIQAVRSECDNWLYCGIYDGFNGRDAADFMSENLLTAMLRHLSDVRWLPSPSSPGSSPDDSCHVSNSRMAEKDVAEVKHALQLAVEETDRDYLSMVDQKMSTCLDVAMVGCCVLSVLISANHLYSINVGDSRAVLATRGREDGDLHAVQLSYDHSLTNLNEQARLLEEHPDEEDLFTRTRLKGKLRVTRALGAGYMKHAKYNSPIPGIFQVHNFKSPPYLISTPYVAFHEVQPGDAFVVMGSDGLFDFFTNVELVTAVDQFMALNPSEDPAKFLLEETLSRAAVKACISVEKLKSIPPGDRRPYHDDVTVLVITLGCGNKFSTASTKDQPPFK